MAKKQNAAARVAPTSEPTYAPRVATIPRVKVCATKAGYYGEVYRRPGDVFIIEGPLPKRPKSADVAGLPAVFSANWMELVDSDTPERVTSHNAALRQQHDEVLAEKVQQARSADSEIL